MPHELVIVLLGSIVQAALCSFLALIIALAMAYFLWQYAFNGRSLFIALLSVCSIMPTKAAALAVDLCYHLRGFWAISFGLLLINVPFAIMLMYQASTCIDSLSLQVAAGLGANPWQCYKDIVWPQMSAAVVRVASIIFIVCFCSVSFCQMLGTHSYHATPDSMMQQAYQVGDRVTVLWYALARILVLGCLGYGMAGRSDSQLPSHIRMHHYRKRYRIGHHRVWWGLLLMATLVFMGAPLYALGMAGVHAGVVSFFDTCMRGQIDVALGVPVWAVVYNSGVLAVGSGMLTLFASGLLAWGASRTHLCAGKQGIQLMLLLPFGIGSVGCGILFDQLLQSQYLTPCMAMLLSHVILNYPLVYHILYARCSAYESEWTRCAQSLGASSWYVWATVHCSFMRPALVQALCLAVSLSMTEVGAAAIVQGDGALTLPMAIRIYRAAGNQAGVIGLTFIVFVLVMIIALLASRMQHEMV